MSNFKRILKIYALMDILKAFDPRKYYWSDLSDTLRLLIVIFYAVIISSVISLTFDWFGINQVVYRNIFLSTVGIVSLYIAYIKYFVKHQNSVQTYVSRGPLQDEKAKRIDINVVNQGQNPVTLMHIPVIWINVTEDKMEISYRLNRRTKPISSASKLEITIREDAYYYKVLEPYLKDKFGEGMRSEVSGIPEETTVDHLSVGQSPTYDINREQIQSLAEEIHRRLEVKISQKAVSKESMSWSLDLGNFEKLSTSQVVDNLMSDRVLRGETSLNDMLYQQLTLKDLNKDWEPVDDEPVEQGGGYMKLRITADVPEFIGTDLEDYGPYEDGDIAEMPDENAEILINRNNAEKID